MKPNVFLCAAVITSAGLSFGADVVSVQFTGTVTSIDDPVGVFAAHSIGDPVFGSYTFDLTVADSDPDPAHGNFVMSIPPSNFLTTIGASTFAPTPASALVVDVNDDDPILHDTLGLQMGVAALPDCLATGSFLFFKDLTDTAISSDVLLVEAPDLNAFGSSSGFVQAFLCGPNDDQPIIRFDVTSVTTAPGAVPAVSAWGMIVIALLMAAVGTGILRKPHATVSHRR